MNMKVNTNGINHSNLRAIDLFGTAKPARSLPPIIRHPSGNWSTRDGDNFAYYVSAKFMEKVRVAIIVSHARNAVYAMEMVCVNVVWSDVTFAVSSMTDSKLSLIAAL